MHSDTILVTGAKSSVDAIPKTTTGHIRCHRWHQWKKLTLYEIALSSIITSTPYTTKTVAKIFIYLYGASWSHATCPIFHPIELSKQWTDWV